MQDSPGPPTIDLTEATARVRALAGFRERRLLGITGPPGAGKSTLSAALLAAVPPEATAVVPMDGYHLAQAELERLGRASRKGAPDTFDAAGFVALLRRVAEQRDAVVYAPEFRREIEEPIANAVPIEVEVPLVLIEGNYLLLDDGPWAAVRGLLDECWYTDLAEDVRLQRLIARHETHGRSPEAAREWVLRSDEANARLIEATRSRADLVVRLG
jgi:pantothenate kinase